MVATASPGPFEMEFQTIPPSLFMMGSPEGEVGRDGDENFHIVELTQFYEIQTTPVTNAQYRQWRDHDSGDFQGHSLNGDDQPVVNTSWNEASAYASWLSTQDAAFSYRLPTEAEWECAARAGTATRYWWGDDACDIGKYANVCDRSCVAALSLPHDNFDIDDGYPVSSPVGRFAPNPFGLYDMLGNVWELCDNWAYRYPQAGGHLVDPAGPPTGAIKVAKGGDYLGIYAFVRAGNRAFNRPADSVNSLGFRLVRHERPVGDAISVRGYTKCQGAIAGSDPTWESAIRDLIAGAQGGVSGVDLQDAASVRANACKTYSAMRDNRLLRSDGSEWSDGDLALMYEWVLKGSV